MMDQGYYYQPPTAQKKPLFSLNRRSLLFIGGGLFAIIMATILLFASRGGGAGDDLALLVARQEQLVELTESSHESISNGDLKKLNADARLFLQSDALVLNEAMEQAGTTKIPKKVAESVVNDYEERLTDAKSAGRFDASYADVLGQKIEAQQALISSVYDKSGSKTKAKLSPVYDSLEVLLEQLQKF